MIKFLIGGSPCTHWSIAQSKNRETTAEGIGWELFKNYLIAKEKFQPDFFLYENNKSAAQAIKDQISEELGQPLQYINSALVSAQNRQRFYVHNIPNVPQPEDRGILLKDIIEHGEPWLNKSYALTTRCNGAIPEDTLKRHRHTMIAERIEPQALAGCVVGRRINEAGHRDDYNTEIERIQRFEVNENPQKTNTISTVEKDNMIAMPIILNATADGKAQCLRASCYKDGIRNLVGNNVDRRTCIAEPANGNTEKGKQIYEVTNGLITIKGLTYQIKLPDGYYIIRKLTVTECCRLQTLPDDYCRVVSNSQAYKGLGNGWTAEVIMHILRHANIPLDEEILVLSMYDGIGTGRYCFDRLGYKNVKYYAYEIDKYPIQIAMSNYPDIIQCGDAFQVRESNWGMEGYGSKYNTAVVDFDGTICKSKFPEMGQAIL
ncbi:MAG: DNA cytosine methyltransferase [Anaerotignum propionicum]|uniref:DNA cytosine methyltransferase n=1 Tax=Anaerotignum propionicum TaxID=28446 RepID=UPI002B21C3F5|nr:DNA cytosine methyltransferase [Anaerotignum propionicum]MEA5057741.1 DNA cytosine methyltransferase [Anaerotignum propionicum]